MRCWPPQGGSQYFQFRMCPGVGCSSGAVAGLGSDCAHPLLSRDLGQPHSHITRLVPGNECHPWRGAACVATGYPQGVHGASGEPWVATVCPNVGSPPGEPRVGRGEALGTPPGFSPSRPNLCCLALSAAGVWFHFTSAAIGALWRAFPGAHVLCLPALPCGPARGRRLPFAAMV